VILLDTNILVYAAGEDHRLRAPCAAIFSAIVAGRVRASTSVEVMQEFLHVYGRRRDRQQACAAARAYLDILEPLVAPLAEVSRQAVELYAAHPGLDSADALLAAVALTERAEALVTADRRFTAIRGLPVFDPAGAEIARLIR
jgi:uncharacterized protein